MPSSASTPVRSIGVVLAPRTRRGPRTGADDPDGVFLRILVHNNEHMGQAIAYARMNGIVPPWSGRIEIRIVPSALSPLSR